MPTENKSNKIITVVLVVIIAIAAITVLYVSLPQNEENNASTGNNEQSGNQTESVVLTVIYGDQQTNYTFPQLENLTAFTGMGGYRTSYPSIKGQGNYTGVPVTTLVELAAGNIENYSVTVYSSDGNKTYNYSMVLGDVDLYNASNASDATPIGNGRATMIIAYMKDGQYLNESQDGKLKTAFVNGREEIITSSDLWRKYVISIEIVQQ